MVKAFDDACHVRHAPATELDVEFVAHFVEPTIRGKCLLIK